MGAPFPYPRRIDTIPAMESLESRLADLGEELAYAGDWTDRYRLLVEWGEALDVLPDDECTTEWEVSGCSSPLWLRVEWAQGRLRIRGASPGVLPKALLAVVVRLFDGLSDVSQVPDVVGVLELRKHLSPIRLMVLEQMLHRAAHCRRLP